MLENGDLQRLAEAEVKVQLAAEECAQLPAVLAGLSFLPDGKEYLTDHYIACAASPLGGWDFTRLRRVNGMEYLLTEKRWTHDAAGQAIRLEDERVLPETEYQQRMAEAPDCLTLEKQRTIFRGMIGEYPAHVMLDHLELNGQSYDFLECEVLAAPEHAAAVRQEILAWMRQHLPLSEFREAMSMLELLKSVGAK